MTRTRRSTTTKRTKKKSATSQRNPPRKRRTSLSSKMAKMAKTRKIARAAMAVSTMKTERKYGARKESTGTGTTKRTRTPTRRAYLTTPIQRTCSTRTRWMQTKMSCSTSTIERGSTLM